MMSKLIKASILAVAISSTAIVEAGSFEFIDMTHAIPTFSPSSEDATKPDLNKPIANSSPITGFYDQAILYPIDNWPTNQGYFRSTAILIQEHNGTSFNAPNHYVNNPESTEEGALIAKTRKAIKQLTIAHSTQEAVKADGSARLTNELTTNNSITIPNIAANLGNTRKSAEQLTTAQLTGDVVMIDVSARVAKELNKNGGVPSPDLAVTDFSDSSMATIRAQDIRAVADQIKEGVWVVGNVGWDQFYFSGTDDWDKSQYTNALNHPGFTAEAIDELIKIMDEKQVTIAGIAADSLSTDSGQGAKGSDDKWSNGWPAHVRLYQRDIIIVENLANVDKLAAKAQGSCALMVGALKHTGGTGGPARVMAVCN
ncbi:MAG: cyclase family protein [Oceanospirillaceae bacterium]|nr:cyclase family protein [Oceanospirillaceae bacterium]